MTSEANVMTVCGGTGKTGGKIWQMKMLQTV
jgi:hypothetical protein